MNEYTEEDYREFKRLVEMAESSDQMDRITSRMDTPKLVHRLGQDVCDKMFARLCEEEPLD